MSEFDDITRLRKERNDWRRKYFEMSNAHSQLIDRAGELTARIMLRERELSERSSDKNAAEREIASLRSQLAGAAWISVSERIPPLMEDVQVLIDDGDVRRAHREMEEREGDDMKLEDSFWYSHHTDQEVYNVTHWRLLALIPQASEVDREG